MHLSMISDCYLSDTLNDAGLRAADAPAPTAGHAHREGLARGLVVMGVAGLLLGLTFLSCPTHPAEAGSRCGAKIAASSRPQATVWWETNAPVYQSSEALRPFHAYAQTGTAVSLVALRQRFRSACR